MTFAGISLSRRRWLGLVASSLAAGCGGGADFASLPGTGGTGITALGNIAGFGSVVVNGVRYDDTAATIEVDGVRALATDLRLGMVALVQGTRGTDPLLATASRIATWSLAQGALEQVTPVGGGVQLRLAGLTVDVDASTVLDGLGSTASLVVGQRVTVWGLQVDAQGTRWHATRLALTAASDWVSTGLLGRTGGVPTLNGWSLSGALLAGVADGQLVRVAGTALASGHTVQVTSVQVQDPGVTLPDGEDVEIEGWVTSLLSGSRFLLGGVTVDGSALPAATALLKVGDRIEVKGRVQAGVLRATAFEQEDEQSVSEVEIEARIEQFTSLANFVVRSQRCDASGVTAIENGTVADLRVGVKVKVKGVKAGDTLRVTSLKIDD